MPSPSLLGVEDGGGRPSSSAPPRANKRSLILLWASQFVSILGTEVSKFALRTWSFQSTGAVSDYSWVIFWTEFPSIVLSPFTGAIADRYNRKVVMMGADLAAGLATLALCLLWQRGAMEVWHLYVAVTVQAIMNSLQLPAFLSTISLLLADEEAVVKWNGLNQAASGVAMLLAPTIASALLATKPSLSLVFALDFSTLIAASLLTLVTPIPTLAERRRNRSRSRSGSGSLASKPRATSPPSQGQGQRQRPSPTEVVAKLWQDNAAAWRLLRERPGLLALLVLVAQIQLTNGAFQILSTPIVLSFAAPSAIASVMTVSGLGAMCGFALPAALKRLDAHRARVVLACVFFQGLLLLLLSVPRLPAVLLVGFGYMGLVPLSRACREAIWMKKVDLDFQGRVFALQLSITKLSLPLAAVLAGPLVDGVLQPAVDASPFVAWLAGSGSISSFSGSDQGGGKSEGGAAGRGSALLAVVLGALNMCSAAFVYTSRAYRELDAAPPGGGGSEPWEHAE